MTDLEFHWGWWERGIVAAVCIIIALVTGLLIAIITDDPKPDPPKQIAWGPDEIDLEEGRKIVAECHAKAAIQNYQGRYVVDECWMSGDDGANWTKIYYGGEIPEELWESP